MDGRVELAAFGRHAVVLEDHGGRLERGGEALPGDVHQRGRRRGRHERVDYPISGGKRVLVVSNSRRIRCPSPDTLPRVGGATRNRIHTEDAARAMAAAIDAGANGTWHVVDDEPVTTATFLETVAAVLGAGPPSRVPGWLAKRFVGEDPVRFLTSDFPTSNERFADAVEWEPTYRTVADGLEEVRETWISEGVLDETADGYELA